MQKLADIKAAYDWLLEQIEAQIRVHASTGDIASVDRFEAKRDLLERGIFVLMFGQFEVAVNRVFETARDDRSSNPDWARRRAWDVPSLQGRVPFETRLAMVMDRRSEHFGRILTAYARRNHCAHGGTSDPVGSIDLVFADLYLWRAELRS
ncbi:MAG: hypothetical protein ACFE0R_01415 [Salinarimonas sp.]